MSQSRRRTATRTDQLWNVLALVVLGLAVLVVIYFVAIFISPSLAPFGNSPEPTLVALLNTPTAKPTIATTPTSEVPPPTWTPEPTRTAPPTSTPLPSRPTRTPRPTVYFTPLPTETGTPTPTIHPYPFKLVDEGIAFQRYPFSSECNWLGIAGEVVNKDGEGVIGVPVVINGGGFQNRVTYSGDAAAYAPSGWEHFLDVQVKEGDFTVQLYRVVGDKAFPISESVAVHTRRDCRANLAYVVFEQAWEDYNLP
jgi:hypothetical protein